MVLAAATVGNKTWKQIFISFRRYFHWWDKNEKKFNSSHGGVFGKWCRKLLISRATFY